MKIQKLIPVVVVTLCVLSSSQAPAVIPSPDGGYPGFTTAEGTKALQNLSTGVGNSGLGWYSLFTNSVGNYNTGVGAGTLALNTADGNTAIGAGALLSNTTAPGNTATGALALLSNSTGSSNTAVGAGSLTANTTGFRNTAIGSGSLEFNTIGERNTATGNLALTANIDGSDNTAVGDDALVTNSHGSFQIAVGKNALAANTTANNNTAVGYGALQANTTGNSNIALGMLAGAALTTGDNNVDIGNVGVAGEAGTIRIGIQGIQFATYVAGINGATVPSGISVIVDNNGHLGTFTSSERFKQDIKAMGQSSEILFGLKPVTFHYTKSIDPIGISQFGLVAEDVEKVNPDLIVRDKSGKPYSVRYEQVNAMLLNEFLKEHRKVQELEATVSEQKKQMQVVMDRLEEQAAQVQRVTARIDVVEPTLRVIASGH